MNAYVARIAFALFASAVTPEVVDDALDHVERRLDDRRPRMVDDWHGDYPLGIHPDQLH